MWQTIAAVAVPIIGAVIGFFKGEHRTRIGRRLREHVKLLEAVRDNEPAATALNALIAAEAEEVRDRELRRLARKVNWTNVILSVVLTGLVAIAIYGLVEWVLASMGTFWVIVAVATLGMLGGLGALVVGAAFSTIFNPPNGAAPKLPEGSAST